MNQHAFIKKIAPSPSKPISQHIPPPIFNSTTAESFHHNQNNRTINRNSQKGGAGLPAEGRSADDPTAAERLVRLSREAECEIPLSLAIQPAQRWTTHKSEPFVIGPLCLRSMVSVDCFPNHARRRFVVQGCIRRYFDVLFFACGYFV